MPTTSAVLIPHGRHLSHATQAAEPVLALLVPTDGRRTDVRLWRDPSDAPARACRAALTDEDAATLLVPWAALTRDLRTLPASDCCLTADLPSSALLVELVGALVRDEVRSTSPHVAGLLTDLTATLLAELAQAGLAAAPAEDGAAPQSPHRRLLDELRWHVNTGLGDAELSPQEVAARHHISVRQLHKVFAAEGTTLGRWVLQRRLEESARELAKSGITGRKIAATATRWGFSNAAHFSRVFRDAFGVAPQEWRAIRTELALHAGPGQSEEGGD
ncbi:helix-turn-helix transcriptional regulator [Streptacidiphilus fuscans]|uniref:Helix-turn-helix transcriptional regulator n=1 Tax=Streptacidiphilus fuscans TaxID=2789292 RepID=A0A931FDP4_9ACTN|nr:helix-turn-helix transcriptional regulator [Streptacidiphilus fuscans]MBF9066694.1 helix-turn-helix transcriptional regulator [Streptacidiphilus fuscans]